MATSEHITTDTASLGDLIENCALMPPALGTTGPVVPPQRTARPWVVDDTCLSQVLDLDDYGS